MSDQDGTLKKKYATLAAAAVVIIMLIVLYISTKTNDAAAEKLMTMTINAENLNNKSLQNVMYGSSPDPRFNLMTNGEHFKQPQAAYPTSNIYALGQHDAEWQVWRDSDGFSAQNPSEQLSANIYSLGQHDAKWRVWRPDSVKSIQLAEDELSTQPEAFVLMKAKEKLMPPNQYGALGKGANRALTVSQSDRAGTGNDWNSAIRNMRSQARMREKMDNADVFRGPPGYDITIVRDKSEENLSNSITWKSLGSQEKMGVSRDAQLMSSLYSL